MKIPGQAPLWMSGAYFAFYAGIACWGPYAVLYYQQICAWDALVCEAGD